MLDERDEIAIRNMCIFLVGKQTDVVKRGPELCRGAGFCTD